MRTRLFVITSVVVAAVAGASSTAAHAAPKGPGGISQAPSTTTPPQQPKDKLAPKPTPTTVAPGPKGPGDLAPAPKDNDDVDSDVVDPADAPANNPTFGAPVPSSDTKAPKVGSGAEQTPEPAASAAADTQSDGVPPLALIAGAAVVGALLALVVGRSRRDGEAVEHV